MTTTTTITPAADRWWEELPAGRGRLRGRAHLRSDAPELSLDGTWEVRFGNRADGSDLGLPARIQVPGMWQLQGHGSPQYTNVVYPIPRDVPHVPDENPTGHYSRTVSLPEPWPERIATGDRVLLRLQGVDSAARIWIDDVEVGVTAGSRLTQEFDVTALLADGETHVLDVRVVQWSVNTYLEDQDMWWTSGIFRSVDLLLRPAGGIHDLLVHADLDPATADASLSLRAMDLRGAGLPVHVEIPDLSVSLDLPAVGGSIGPDVLGEVAPWSAESPSLYDVEVSAGGETVRLRVGFRRVEVDGEILRVNGERVVLRGVNRHEADPRVGRTQHEGNQDLDAAHMKRHNVNAVRTSHYPPHQRFLDVCDEVGLYVVCEGDFEAHGFHADTTGEDRAGAAERPAADERFRESLIERTDRFVRRDVNHPSIILWSIGNEASTGPVTTAMVQRVREVDASRPVLYEQDYLATDVDVFSLMYPSHEETEQIGRREISERYRSKLAAMLRHLGVEPEAEVLADPPALRKPFLWIEYAHAMGNGPGSLREYMELTRRYPALQGGFIWEWIDHGLETNDPEGRPIFGYGGDFGERLHDANFVADGLVLPDRTPSPALLDAAHHYSPVGLEVGPTSVGIENRYAFLSLSHCRAEVSRDDQSSWHELPLPALSPGESAEVPLPGEASSAVTVRVLTRGAQGPVPAGHVIVAASHVDPLLLCEEYPLPAAGQAPRPEGRGWRVGPALLDDLGRLVRLGSLDIADAGVDLWRAPVDNERSFTQVDLESRWRRIGLDAARSRLVFLEADATGVTVRRRIGLDGSGLGADVRERYESDGTSLVLHVDVAPSTSWPVDLPLPRVGWTLSAPGDLDMVGYLGMGPHESYPDTGGGTTFGAWAARVADLQVPYVLPQENGNRAQVVSAHVRGEERGLHLTLPDGLGLAVRPWSTAELDRRAHDGSLRPDGRTWVSVSAALHGVGSAACGPEPLPAYVLGARPVSFRMALTPSADGDSSPSSGQGDFG